MSMFDSIINEAGEKFNLGGKAGLVLSALLSAMTDGTRGGFAGFLEKFNRAALGNTSSSWIYSGANTPISNEQLESALGTETLNDIANQAGTDYDTATSATAFMTPRVVDALTPNGVMPEDNDLLAKIDGYLTGVGGAPISATVGETGAATAETFDRIGTAATDTLEADNRVVDEKIDRVDGATGITGDKSNDALDRVEDDNDGDDSPLKWLIPLLLLVLLLVMGYWFCGKSSEPVKPANVNANSNI